MNHMPLNKSSWLAKPKNFLLIVLLLYGILGVILLPFYKYQVTVDGISYISSAQKLLRGDFYNAITGHWSPLYSILLVPFLYIGLDPSLAAKTYKPVCRCGYYNSDALVMLFILTE